MKRKQGELVPNEISIINAAMELLHQGNDEFHGFQIAKAVKAREGRRFESGYGTLYRALERLEQQGFLTSYWEDPNIAADEKRPRRRFYRLTGKAVPASTKLASEGAPVNWALGRSLP